MTQEPEDRAVMQLPIHWLIPENISSRYANNIVIQHTEDEFVLSFFEIHPPLMLGLSEEVSEEQLPDAVEAECVARIIVSRNKIESFIEALETNFARYKDKFEAEG
jgi:hypothetical protein